MRSMRPGFPTSLSISVYESLQICYEIESLASRTLSAALQLRFAQNDMMGRLLIPDLNINNLICFQRLTDPDPQQRIRLAQTKKRVRFLTTERHEFSVFESAADIMWSIAVAR